MGPERPARLAQKASSGRAPTALRRRRRTCLACRVRPGGGGVTVRPLAPSHTGCQTIDSRNGTGRTEACCSRTAPRSSRLDLVEPRASGALAKRHRRGVDLAQGRRRSTASGEQPRQRAGLGSLGQRGVWSLLYRPVPHQPAAARFSGRDRTSPGLVQLGAAQIAGHIARSGKSLRKAQRRNVASFGRVKWRHAQDIACPQCDRRAASE